jgi:2-succinyl-5-enolpyruvyl-6-hydroxy-3-cyclohexene-1-carboxylate synthase
MIDRTNRNMLWASIMVDELVRCGVRHAVIAPGSRSTPLTVAFSREASITVHGVLDERAAAFMALGIGMASGVPAAAVCTSGTAAANFYPAIIEANQSNVPLLALTTDRPHDLRDSGANQTIDQVKLYGDHVRWFVDVSPPEANPADGTLRSLRTTINRAVAYATGPNGGPVHLNIPFRAPLEPTPVQGDVPAHLCKNIGVQGRANGQPFSQSTWQCAASEAVIARVVHLLAESVRGVIIAGPHLPSAIAPLIGRLSAQTGYPILAEPLSGVRFAAIPGVIIGGYEGFLRGETARRLRPDLLVHFGAMPVSQVLLDYLEYHADVPRLVLTEVLRWADGLHTASEVITTDLHSLLRGVLQAGRLGPSPNDAWSTLFRRLESDTWSVLGTLDRSALLEGGVLADVVEALPAGASLFVASSNPVRHLDQFVPPQCKPLCLYANRGASGIDGTLASALGVAAGNQAPLTLVLGDLALYHDLNSLHLLRRLRLPLIIVVINNNGGGIFYRLPIAAYEPPFRDLFQTPHGLTFAHAAQMFHLPYTLAHAGHAFRMAFETALASGEPHLIEVPSDAARFEQQRRTLITAVQQRIAASHRASL